MSNHRFSNALGYTFEQLADMHNTSFSGYFMPVSMTPEQTADFWRTNQIDANRCVVMHDANNVFVGMARMGTRGTRGWCGGFGIVPEFRGSGASKLLAGEMVRIARETGLDMLQLEVLTQNIRARKLYEGAGFAIRRRLLGLEIATSALPAGVIPSIEHLSLETALSRLQQAPTQPCWNLEPASLLTMNVEAFAVSGSDKASNIFVIQRSNNVARIQAALIQSQLTENEFAALLRSIATDVTIIQVFNEPEESPLLKCYVNLGFTEFFSQYEMILEL